MKEWMQNRNQVSGKFCVSVQGGVEGDGKKMSRVAGVVCFPGKSEERRAVWKVTF